MLASTGKTAEDGGSKGRGSEKRKSLIWRSACSSGSQKSKKSEGRQELHSNLMILMECVLDLALGAPLLIWSSQRRNPLDFALSWTSRSKAARNCAFLRARIIIY